jgi:hypothetical protein
MQTNKRKIKGKEKRIAGIKIEMRPSKLLLLVWSKGIRKGVFLL